MRLECVPTERAGAGKLDGVIRVKDYLSDAARIGQYTPVYDVASRLLGCTWAEANRVAVCDTVGCSLNCWYCYQRGRSTQEISLAVPDIVNLFIEDAIDSPVWRVSGGEPLLQPDCVDLLAQLVEQAEATGHLVLLNTNGMVYREIEPRPNLLIEVSLKGLCAEWADWVTGHSGVWERQLGTACGYAQDEHMVMLNLVCLAPEGSEFEEGLRAAIRLRDELADIDRTLPLRVTPVLAKHYEWCPEWPKHIDLSNAWREAVAQTYGWLDCITPAAAFLEIGK